MDAIFAQDSRYCLADFFSGRDYLVYVQCINLFLPPIWVNGFVRCLESYS